MEFSHIRSQTKDDLPIGKEKSRGSSPAELSIGISVVKSRSKSMEDTIGITDLSKVTLRKKEEYEGKGSNGRGIRQNLQRDKHDKTERERNRGRSRIRVDQKKLKEILDELEVFELEYAQRLKKKNEVDD
jgi:hypothetical protein